MNIITGATKLDGTNVNVSLDITPDTCPRCHRSVHPKFLSAFVSDELFACQAVFRCANLQCQEIFIGTYAHLNDVGGRKRYLLTGVQPRNALKTEFAPVVQDVSPNFCVIFNQAEAAGAMQLDQLVGIGLRKALEFLVKDFAVAEQPEKEDEIRRALLGSCINQYIADSNIKECAKRAAWLGNDETHYTRKWETKDVGDLRLLVRLTVNWIENSLLTKKYLSEMQ